MAEPFEGLSQWHSMPAFHDCLEAFRTIWPTPVAVGAMRVARSARALRETNFFRWVAMRPISLRWGGEDKLTQGRTPRAKPKQCQATKKKRTKEQGKKVPLKETDHKIEPHEISRDVVKVIVHDCMGNPTMKRWMNNGESRKW